MKGVMSPYKENALGQYSDIYLQVDADGAQTGQTAVFYVENSRKLQC
jgi:hypothetical protein